MIFAVILAVENMRIRVPFVATADNLADFFTKPLPAKAFYPLRDAIMNVAPHARYAPADTTAKPRVQSTGGS